MGESQAITAPNRVAGGSDWLRFQKASRLDEPLGWCHRIIQRPWSDLTFLSVIATDGAVPTIHCRHLVLRDRSRSCSGMGSHRVVQ